MGLAIKARDETEASCEEPLPEIGAELHRIRAIEGYTAENTRLLCTRCHANAETLSELI